MLSSPSAVPVFILKRFFYGVIRGLAVLMGSLWYPEIEDCGQVGALPSWDYV